MYRLAGFDPQWTGVKSLLPSMLWPSAVVNTKSSSNVVCVYPPSPAGCITFLVIVAVASRPSDKRT